MGANKLFLHVYYISPQQKRGSCQSKVELIVGVVGATAGHNQQWNNQTGKEERMGGNTETRKRVGLRRVNGGYKDHG